MILPGLSGADAALMYEAWRAGQGHPPSTFEVGLGSRDEGLDLLTNLKAASTELLEKYQDRTDAQALAEFDAECAVRLHGVLRIPSYVIASDPFWRYLACVEMWDLVVWRHGSEDGDGMTVGRDHFGLGDRWESLPKRLWMRGEISYDETLDDPYELAVRGGMDFWMSGVIRRLYASSRPFARAFIRFQFPEAGSFRGRAYRPQTLGTDSVRKLYKRLRHFQAFVAFSTLEEAEATELIESIAGDLRPAATA